MTVPPRRTLTKAPRASVSSDDVVSQVLGDAPAPEQTQPAARATSARPVPVQSAPEPSAPVRQGPGRPATRKGRYEPFSTKISIPLRDRLDAEIARVRGTEEELTIVSVLEAALTNWLDAREQERST